MKKSQGFRVLVWTLSLSCLGLILFILFTKGNFKMCEAGGGGGGGANPASNIGSANFSNALAGGGMMGTASVPGGGTVGVPFGGDRGPGFGPVAGGEAASVAIPGGGHKSVPMSDIGKPTGGIPGSPETILQNPFIKTGLQFLGQKAASPVISQAGKFATPAAGFFGAILDLALNPKARENAGAIVTTLGKGLMNTIPGIGLIAGQLPSQPDTSYGIAETGPTMGEQSATGGPMRPPSIPSNAQPPQMSAPSQPQMQPTQPMNPMSFINQQPNLNDLMALRGVRGKGRVAAPQSWYYPMR